MGQDKVFLFLFENFYAKGDTNWLTAQQHKYIFDRAYVLFDENNNPCRMIGAMQDITYQVTEELRMSKAIIDAQEQERRFIGGELHDNVNQVLTTTVDTTATTTYGRNTAKRNAPDADVVGSDPGGAVPTMGSAIPVVTDVRSDL